MLTNVHVKNLALIEETEIDFSEGLNILTGETGAGKSIIIGSINYCLGQKADKDVIREGAEYALVELTFQVDDESIASQVKEMDFPIEDGMLILSRKIMPARSAFKINGEAVTAKQMKDLANILIDIHGQHEHQSLLSEKKQAKLLDKYADAKLAKIKTDISKLYKEYLSVKESLESYSIDDSQREREISLAEYEINEIENANLLFGEEDELNKKYKRMQNGKKTAEAIARTLGYLNENDSSALELIGYATKELYEISDSDDEAAEFRSRIFDIEGVLSDFVRDASNYMESLDFSEEDFYNTEERLNVINNLSMKYGGSIDKVLEYLQKRQAELENLKSIDETREKLGAQLKELNDKIMSLCEKAHEVRVKQAAELSKKISDVLEELNFLKVNFEITVNKRESFNSEGFDDVIFMISLNPGEKLKPISMVASGGELSRIMLALKSVFADNDNIETMIFDEIDTGISGKTAWKVSGRMGEIARKYQVICITHLPQIAAMADKHFLIEKCEKAGKTVTSINQVLDNSRIDELSRMLGSDNITDTVRANAKELIKMAEDYKK